MRVFWICIGNFGRIVWMPRIHGVDVVLRSIPAGGNTLIVSRSTRLARTRSFLGIAAGPAVHLLMILLVLAVLDVDRIGPLTGLVSLAFVISNVWVFATSMWPRTYLEGSQRIPNDGMLLWQVLHLQDNDIEASHAYYHYLEALECRERHQPAAAAEWLERGRAFYPDDKNLSLGRALLLLDAAKGEAARTLLIELLSKEGDESSWQPYGASYIAWACLLSARREFMAEALDRSQQAYAAYPWHVDVLGIRGRVLVAAQRDDEGTLLLEKALKKDDSKMNRAHNACYLALSCARLGNGEQSMAYLSAARKLDKNSVSLSMVEQEISRLDADRLRSASADSL